MADAPNAQATAPAPAAPAPGKAAAPASKSAPKAKAAPAKANAGAKRQAPPEGKPKASGDHGFTSVPSVKRPGPSLTDIGDALAAELDSGKSIDQIAKDDRAKERAKAEGKPELKAEPKSKKPEREPVREVDAEADEDGPEDEQDAGSDPEAEGEDAETEGEEEAEGDEAPETEAEADEDDGKPVHEYKGKKYGRTETEAVFQGLEESLERENAVTAKAAEYKTAIESLMPEIETLRALREAVKHGNSAGVLASLGLPAVAAAPAAAPNAAQGADEDFDFTNKGSIEKLIADKVAAGISTFQQTMQAQQQEAQRKFAEKSFFTNVGNAADALLAQDASYNAQPERIKSAIRRDVMEQLDKDVAGGVTIAPTLQREKILGTIKSRIVAIAREYGLGIKQGVAKTIDKLRTQRDAMPKTSPKGPSGTAMPRSIAERTKGRPEFGQDGFLQDLMRDIEEADTSPLTTGFSQR